MPGRFRPPMFVVAGALLGLIVTLATLQYRWLGQISDAERHRMRATLGTRTTEFAQDFDRELTRAYLLFQQDFSTPGEDAGERIATRYDRWQATARFPRLLREFYVASRDDEGTLRLSRLNAANRKLEPCEWPPSMADWREQLAGRSAARAGDGDVTIRSIPPPVWDTVPALVVPMPLVILSDATGKPNVRLVPQLSYSILEIDRDYVTRDLLPALAQQHFRGTGEGFDYQVAVVRRAPGTGVVYSSTPSFAPKPDEQADASTDLFQVRTRDFGAVEAEVRRFTTFTATVSPPGGAALPGTSSRPLPSAADRIRIERELAARMSVLMHDRAEIRGAPLSIIVQKRGSSAGSGGGMTAMGAGTTRLASADPPRWTLLLKHPSGSLEAAVNAARRRNLVVSTTILAVLGASVGLLVLSTRRAQELARRQMEFVAAVSHELRTPLAVIRSAGENLADGVVRDDAQIKKYGNLVRNEGRRLTDMVEQILEFAGMQSGQRGLALRPVAIRTLLEEVVAASGALVEAAHLEVEYDVPEALPPVLGDEPSLRRVFQNLIGNAIKVGTGGGWIGLRARSVGREVEITVADRGIGIAPAEQPRIFEPFYRTADVVAAQIQGAGLGLSLVKRIIEAHGGQIRVHSAPGAGSEFTVVLPSVGAGLVPVLDVGAGRADAPSRS